MILGAAGTLSSCYVLGQGAHLLSYQLRAEPVETVRAETEATFRKEFFDSVAAIREFAKDELRLADTDNYTTFVEIDRDHLVTVVSATAKYGFERKTWWFPFFGRFPYKGYYNEDAAKRLARRLERRGHDVFVRRVDAFSTLGYFRDPLFSFMTDYDTFRLASLIIHEQTHATLFLKNRIQFNEELATFVGYQGALAYVERLHGADSKQYRDASAYWNEIEAFLEEIRNLHGRLAELYAEADDSDLPEAEVQARKQAVIQAFQREFEQTYDQRFVTDGYRWFSEYRVNNAVIDVYMKYTRDLELFERAYDAVGSSIPKLLEALAPLRDYRGDPKDFVRTVILDEGRQS